MGMRIAIPIHSFEPGGVERVALRLAERWQGSGAQVTVVLGRARGRCRDSAPDLNYRTLREPFATERWETLWMIWSLFQFLLMEDVDVIFCPGNSYTIVCAIMKLLFGNQCPVVLAKISNDLERRDLPAPARPFYGLWLTVQGRMLDHFVGLAEPMRREMEASLGVWSGRISIIPDPALSQTELERLAQDAVMKRRKNDCRFLSIGRLCSQKNQANLIEAFARNSWPDDTLVLAGEGPQRRKIEELIAYYGLAERVTLLGHVDDIAALMAEADIFVLSSDYEGVPAVIIEALAAGLPIATTNCCASMAWLTGHERFGVVCPTGDPLALGAAMNLARHITPPRAAMRALAMRFTLEASSDLYLNAFAELHSRHLADRAENLQRCVWDWQRPGV